VFGLTVADPAIQAAPGAPDPQCAGVSTVLAAGVSLRDRCNNGISALAVVNPDGSQSLVLQNAQPGTRGNLGSNTMEGPGRWSLDASLSKGFRLAETKTLQVRFDATNILNRVTFAAVNTFVGSTQFGLPTTANPTMMSARFAQH